jgi:phosphoglycolate phosphatase
MHVLLFDIDGTLLNTGGAGQAAMEAALREEFGVTRPVEGIPAAGRTDFAITRDLFAYYELTHDEANWSRFVARYLSMLPRELSRREGLVLPGVTALLDQLAARDDVLLGLLTGNFAAGARLKLVHYALEHHFSFGGYGDHHAQRDDVARTAWSHVQQRHPEVSIDRVWVIGDTPSDIQCARAIGAKVLAVSTGMYSADDLVPHAPDVLRTSLADPHEWVSAWLDAP